MKKGELISKFFGVALVFVMLTSTFGGLIWARESDVVGAAYVDVSVEQAKGMIDSDPDPDLIVLDVRTENEYEAGHIAGAELMPLSELEQKTEELDKDDTLLVYCKSGTRSTEASNILIQHEFESVYNMEGGINAWVSAGYPVVSSTNNLLSSEIDASLDADKPVFLFFHADWCHFCQEQMPIIEELELEYAEEIVVIYVNNEANPQAMTEFGVTAFPTMFLISDKSANGEYRYQEFEGFTGKETLNRSFDRVITNGNISEGSGVDSGRITENEPIEYTPFQVVPPVIPPDVVEIPPLVEERCKFCPKPEPGWGKLLDCTCSGKDQYRKYDPTSRVDLTGCYYENHTLGSQDYYTGLFGAEARIPIIDPLYNYCVDNRTIALYRCVGGVYIQEDTTECPIGCDNRQCLCSDTDGGIDYYESGGVRWGGIITWAADSCLGYENRLREYYTIYDWENDTCIINSTDYRCPYLCRDGACHDSCTNGRQDEDELGIDCGGSYCLRACEYDFGWYAQNYGFKFEGPPGQKLSYGDCWSWSKSCGRGYGHYKDTFGNCEVCICNDFWSCCSGWDINAGLYYPIYWRHAARQGQCLGMCLSSLEFYYGDKEPQDYDPLADEVIDLEYTGSLQQHIASEQGKTVSGEMINHYNRVSSKYWGANHVLNQVEDALGKADPDYGVIFIIEDNGWKGDGRRETPLGHAVIPTGVVYVSNEIAKIYIYDPNTQVDEPLRSISAYVSTAWSPYIEIDKPSNTYTYYEWDTSGVTPRKDDDNQPWSNANDEVFDRIGYLPYEILAGDVRLPGYFDLVIWIGCTPGAAIAQVEDSEGRILGFSEEGPNVPAIENAMILPIFGEPDPEFPTTFALPMADYKVNIFGIGSGTYNTSILGGSHTFVISDAEVSEGTRDTVSLRYGTEGRAMLSFNTNDMEKQYSLLITILGEDDEDATQTLYRVVNSTISYGSEALIGIDPDYIDPDYNHHQALLYANHGDTEVTYSVQIYRALTGLGEEWDDLYEIMDDIPVTQVYNFTIRPMETHTIYPEDWSNLPESEIILEVDKCGDGDCDTHENYLICPEDCPSGALDYYCDGISDDICDPDCTTETDPDCAAGDEEGGVGGGLCFIATAAYGNPMAEEIEVLREFRDEYLLTNSLGQALVDIYYKVSPPIAEFITEHPSLKPIVRAELAPVVAMSTVAVNTTPAEKMAMVGLLLLVSVVVAVWATRRRGKGPEYS